MGLAAARLAGSAAMAGALLAIAASGTPPAEAAGRANTALRPTRSDVVLVRSATVCLLNQERPRLGMPPLRTGPNLLRRGPGLRLRGAGGPGADLGGADPAQPRHRAKLLAAPFQHLGVGIVPEPPFPHPGYTGAKYKIDVGLRCR